MLLRIADTLINWDNVEWVQVLVPDGSTVSTQICVRFGKDANKNELVLRVIDGWEALHQIEQAVIENSNFAIVT